jgi:hypothetical protein
MNILNQNKKNIEVAIASIRKSFTLEKFPLDLIEEIESLVKGSAEFNIENIKAINWRVIVSDNCAGQIYSELEALVQWWRKENISPIYATSLQRFNRVGGCLAMTYQISPRRGSQTGEMMFIFHGH